MKDNIISFLLFFLLRFKNYNKSLFFVFIFASLCPIFSDAFEGQEMVANARRYLCHNSYLTFSKSGFLSFNYKQYKKNQTQYISLIAEGKFKEIQVPKNPNQSEEKLAFLDALIRSLNPNWLAASTDLWPENYFLKTKLIKQLIPLNLQSISMVSVFDLISTVFNDRLLKVPEYKQLITSKVSKNELLLLQIIMEEEVLRIGLINGLAELGFIRSGIFDRNRYLLRSHGGMSKWLYKKTFELTANKIFTDKVLFALQPDISPELLRKMLTDGVSPHLQTIHNLYNMKSIKSEIFFRLITKAMYRITITTLSALVLNTAAGYAGFGYYDIKTNLIGDKGELIDQKADEIEKFNHQLGFIINKDSLKQDLDQLSPSQLNEL